MLGTFRRIAIAAIMIPAAVTFAAPAGAAERSEDSPVQFQWAVRTPDLKALTGSLSKRGATLEPGTRPFVPPANEKEDYGEAKFAPLAVIAGAVAFSVVAQAILDFYRGATRGGVVVDARGRELVIREQPALQPGTILVIGADGKPTRFDASRVDAASLAKAVASGVAK